MSQPPQNALYHTVQMVLVDSYDEFIICLLWLLKGGKQNYWYNKYIYLCLPPFKSHRKQIISLSQVSTRTICIVWYSVISFDPRNILILSFLHTTWCNIWVNFYFSTLPCISEVCGKIPIHPNIACGGVQERQNKVVIFSQNGI